jgi:hypothetical protein
MDIKLEHTSIIDKKISFFAQAIREIFNFFFGIVTFAAPCIFKVLRKNKLHLDIYVPILLVDDIYPNKASIKIARYPLTKKTKIYFDSLNNQSLLSFDISDENIAYSDIHEIELLPFQYAKETRERLKISTKISLTG